jgi:Domain of unknown function (DUF4276)
MRVFLVGEGPDDIGDLAGHPSFRGGRPGFLQPIVEKIVGSRAVFDGSKVALLSKRRVSRCQEALEAQAELAAALAVNAESELLVFVKDLDSGSDSRRRNPAADVRQMSNEIRRGSSSSSGSELECVPGIACRTIEAWALGDRDAVVAACHLGEAVELPNGKKPEELWGKPRDSSSNHPKMVLKRIVGRKPTREDFAAIAEYANVDTIRDSCPISFAPFAAELEAAT